jgi:hypothetical protein
MAADSVGGRRKRGSDHPRAESEDEVRVTGGVEIFKCASKAERFENRYRLRREEFAANLVTREVCGIVEVDVSASEARRNRSRGTSWTGTVDLNDR